jgi:hypothetical protein
VDDDDPGWRAQPWHPAHEVRTVDADHFTVMNQAAGRTAAVIEEWLSAGLGRPERSASA